MSSNCVSYTQSSHMFTVVHVLLYVSVRIPCFCCCIDYRRCLPNTTHSRATFIGVVKVDFVKHNSNMISKLCEHLCVKIESFLYIACVGCTLSWVNLNPFNGSICWGSGRALGPGTGALERADQKRHSWFACKAC